MSRDRREEIAARERVGQWDIERDRERTAGRVRIREKREKTQKEREKESRGSEYDSSVVVADSSEWLEAQWAYQIIFLFSTRGLSRNPISPARLPRRSANVQRNRSRRSSIWTRIYQSERERERGREVAHSSAWRGTERGIATPRHTTPSNAEPRHITPGWFAGPISRRLGPPRGSLLSLSLSLSTFDDWLSNARDGIKSDTTPVWKS